MPSDDDRALMSRAAAGDESSRREVVRRVLPRAQRLCHSLLRNPADAKDASQTAVIDVLRSAATYRGESSLEHWADRIVARTALRLASSARRTYMLPLPEDEVESVRSAVLDSTHQLLAKQCLERLSEAQRTALLLRCGFEYSVEEIAELTGVSPNTVKDRILRARRTVRQLIHRDPSRSSTTEERDPDDGDTIPLGSASSVPKS
jgi:RNA polymerase sigma-70 factor (ECF subfamily)